VALILSERYKSFLAKRIREKWSIKNFKIKFNTGFRALDFLPLRFKTEEK